MIRRAKPSEIEKILSITRDCALEMQANGIFQWNEIYPSREAFQKDLEHDELFVIVDKDDDLFGCITISTTKDKEYEPVQWLDEDGLNFYIHRLAVHPSLQGKGHAQKLMDFAESLAREKKADSIRLDTFSKNLRNQRFYEQRGYQRLGEVYFPSQSKDPFYCFEMLLR